MMQLKRKVKTSSGVRDFCVCRNEKIYLAVTYDIVKIYDADLGHPINQIKLDVCPRIVKLAPNGNYFVVFQSMSTITIYDTYQGTILQKIYDAPSSIKNIRFSKNSLKILYAGTQILCLWNIRTCSLQMRTQNWKNINCYDVSENGQQFVIGTYNGTIYVNNFLGIGRCSQIQIKRHTTCVVAICFHQNKIISVSYDGFFLITSLSTSLNGERLVSYNQMRVKSIPRQIQSIGNNFYMFDHKGITWFKQGFVLVGLVDSRMYKILINQDGQLICVKLVTTQMEWWKITEKK